MIYYITQITDDTVTIKNNMDEKVVGLEDLKYCKDTIVGYNRVTGSLKITTKADALYYVTSRNKLAGNDIKLGKLFDYNIEVTEDGVRVTIALEGFDGCEILDDFEVDYEIMWNKLFDFSANCNIPTLLDENNSNTNYVKLDIVYDLPFKTESVLKFERGDFENLASRKSHKLFRISNVTFTDRTDLTKLGLIGSIFNYFDFDKGAYTMSDFIGINVYELSVGYMPDATVHMGNITIDRATNINYIFYGYCMNIEPPKFIGKARLSSFASKYSVLNTIDKLEQLNTIAKAYNSNERALLILYFDKERVLNISEIKDYDNTLNVFDTTNLKLDVDSKVLGQYNSVGFLALENLYVEDAVSNLCIDFDSDFFNFVLDLTDEEKETMRQFILQYIEGTFGNVHLSVLCYNYGDSELPEFDSSIIIQEFEDILKRVNGLNACKLLQKIHLYTVDRTVIKGTISAQFTTKDVIFILLLFVSLPQYERNIEEISNNGYHIVHYNSDGTPSSRFTDMENERVDLWF